MTFDDHAPVFGELDDFLVQEAVQSGTMRALLLSTVASGNLHPKEYKISNAQEGRYSTEYKEEFFDVYSPPLKSEYAQVIWRMMPSVPLPPEIVARFQNKTMAIRGYEVDQVMRSEKGDIPVPITWAYNHHYVAYIGGRDSYLFYKSDDIGALKHGYNHGASGYWTMKKRSNAIASHNQSCTHSAADVRKYCMPLFPAF